MQELFILSSSLTCENGPFRLPPRPTPWALHLISAHLGRSIHWVEWDPKLAASCPHSPWRLHNNESRSIGAAQTAVNTQPANRAPANKTSSMTPNGGFPVIFVSQKIWASATTSLQSSTCIEILFVEPELRKTAQQKASLLYETRDTCDNVTR